MATPPIDSLQDLINRKGLNTGNDVLTSTGAPATASVPLYVDANKKLQAQAIPFALPLTAASTTAALLDFTGTATADVLTQTIVAGATVTTATEACFVRVNLTDLGDVQTDGAYYIQLFTIE